jgi:trimeric autotransporter adhesin
MKNRKMIFMTVMSAIVCFGLCPVAQAVVPPPDGDYPNFNTAEGQNALFSLSGGVWNTALGALALFSDTTGGANTAVGLNALRKNVDGNSNTAVGVNALFANTTGDQNCAFGPYSLFANTASTNTAFGFAALAHNTVGFSNTAVGNRALLSNIGGNIVQGNNNTAVGANALDSNTTGGFNTALGSGALASNTTGNVNVAIANGLSGMTSGNSNVAIGGNAGVFLDTGSGNVYLGAGMGGVAVEDDHTYIRNINTTGQSFNPGTNNYVTVEMSSGRLGFTTVVSSQRYKEDIKPLDKTSQALFALKPVSFRLKKEYDETQALAFGLIAEEVEKVNPDLVYRNNKGQVESVRYEMVNAMLLNEFLKEHEKVQKLEAQLKEQAVQIQKVSAQLEVNKPAAKVVLSNP